MNYGQDQEHYLCGVEVAGEPHKDSPASCSQPLSLNSSFQQQDLPHPGAQVDLEPAQFPGDLAQTALLPTAMMVMENSHITSSDRAIAPPTCPSMSDTQSSEIIRVRGQSPGLCTLHVEVCQRPDSTLRCTRLKELVLSMLRQRGTAFGELLLQDFEDPVVNEHVQSVAITDVPQELKVRDWRL